MRRPNPFRLLLAALVTAVVTLLPVALDAQLTFGGQPLRQWALNYREYETEFQACLYTMADIETGEPVLAMSIPSDVIPSMSTDSSVTSHPLGGCFVIPNVPLVGIVHSHPTGRCFQSMNDYRSFIGNTSLQYAITVCGFGRFYLIGHDVPPSLCTYTPDEPADLECNAVIWNEGGDANDA